MEELWDLYNENRELLGKTHIRGVPLPEGTYHLVAEVWTITIDGKILITQRHPDKPFGLLWECTGGSVTAGEDSLTGALRELSEEVGIYASKEELIQINSVRNQNTFYDIYVTIQDINPEELSLQPSEVVNARLVTFEELVELVKKGIVIPMKRFEMCRYELQRYVTKCIENNRQ